MNNHLFIAPGDLTQLSADAIAYSASSYLGRDGNLYSAFRANVPGFAEWFADLRREAEEPVQVGDTFWLDLGGDRKPYGLVVGVSTGASETTDKAGTAVRAAFTRAITELRRAGRKGRLLIALPAFRVGRGGDRSQRLHSARLQIGAALEMLTAHDEVDAVFVTYTQTLYQIYLEARRELLGPPPAAAPRYPALEQALLSGECVLFAGAGLSKGAGLPDWNALMRRLTDALSIAWRPGLDYLDLAQWYRERFGAAALAEVIRSTFSDPALTPRPTLAHYLLLSLPVRHVITTNYDDLLERALTGLKRYPSKVVQQSDVARTGEVGVHVVKLHGDVSHPEEIVLCRDDYDDFFHRRPAMALLLEGMLLNQTFLFVGYGLRDPNFRQVYSRVARILREARRPAYATTFEASGDTGDYLCKQWQHKQLELIPIPGASDAEREHEFLRFVDGLAERVTLSRPGLFLAPDVAVSPPLAALRGALTDQVGSELERLAEHDLSGPDARAHVRHLEEVLGFLATHGWRPRTVGRRDLCRLWERLAEVAPNDVARRRLLVRALGAAEANVDVQRIRTLLAEREAPDPGW